jgi:hypothetical protein
MRSPDFRDEPIRHGIRIEKIALWLLLTAVVWCFILATIIWRYGTHDHAIKSDCIIVLGAAVKGSNPSLHHHWQL